MIYVVLSGKSDRPNPALKVVKAEPRRDGTGSDLQLAHPQDLKANGETGPSNKSQNPIWPHKRLHQSPAALDESSKTESSVVEERIDATRRASRTETRSSQKRKRNDSVPPWNNRRRQGRMRGSDTSNSFAQDQVHGQTSKPQQHEKPSSQLTATGVPQIPRAHLRCANCGELGHPLGECTRHVDPDGFVNGCPPCNIREHLYDACTLKKARDEYHFLVTKRHNKPPIRTKLDFRLVNATRFQRDKCRPHTREFSAGRARLGIQQDPSDCTVEDPHWTDPTSVIGSQSHPLDAPRVWPPPMPSSGSLSDRPSWIAVDMPRGLTSSSGHMKSELDDDDEILPFYKYRLRSKFDGSKASPQEQRDPGSSPSLSRSPASRPLHMAREWQARTQSTLPMRSPHSVSPAPHNSCDNCHQVGHAWKNCLRACGACGKWGHKSPECTESCS